MKLTLTKTKWDGDPGAHRDLFIGGSDMGTILGLNQFKSAYTLWAEKTGLIETPDISDKLSVWFGTEEEEIVAKRFCVESGKKVKKSLISYGCKEYPYLIGHIDRLVVGEDAGLECKTTSSWNRTNYMEGEMPPAHYAQCQFYMMLTGRPLWYYAVKRDNCEFYWTTVERNDDFIENTMLPAAIEFWNCVNTKTPPETDGSDSTTATLNALYPPENATDEEESVQLGNTVNDLIFALTDLDQNIKELEKAKEEIKNTIKARMGDNIRGSSRDYDVKWKPQTRNSFDSKALKENEPEIYEQYIKTTTSRVFTYKKKKVEE